VIFGINTTSDISKLFYIISRAVRRVKFGAILKYHKWYLCQISRTIHAINCLYYNLRNLVELFCFVGKQIGFEVIVFGPAGPVIEPGRCTFLSILVLVLESPDLKISESFCHFCQLVRRDYLMILGYHSNCNFHM